MAEVELENRSRTETFQIEDRSSGFSMAEIPSGVWWLLGVLGFIAVLLILILVPTSYKYVEYNQYAFKKDTTRNDVDLSKVYTNGQYYWGPTHAAVAFPREYQTIEFTSDGAGSLSIFTDSGIEIIIEASLQYYIRPEKLAALYTEFGLNYQGQVVTVARSALKNIAPHFLIDDYYMNREQVSAELEVGVADALNSIGIGLGGFQLRDVDLGSKEINTLNILIQQQQNLKEQYIQNATSIRKQIVTQQKEIEAQITQIQTQAAATAAQIKSLATAQAFQISNTAKNQALANLFNALGMTTTELRLSLLYALGIQDLENVNIVLGTTTTVVNQI